MKVAVGIDVGGTRLKGGLVREDGKILKRLEQEVADLRDAKKIVGEIAQMVKDLGGAASGILGVGVGIPGIVHFEKGTVLESPHFPEWRDFPVRGLLSEALSLPIFIDNDANMAALGELRWGYGKGLRSFIMLTLGTGIGGALVLNEKLWRGEEGFAGEVGHIVVEADGLACPCGGRGCLELYASAQALRRQYPARQPDEIYKRALGGDEGAKAFWRRFGTYFGIGIASLVNVLGVYTVVIGGGVSGAWPLFAESCETQIRSRIYRSISQKIKVLPAMLKEDAGILGSAATVFGEAS